MIQNVNIVSQIYLYKKLKKQKLLEQASKKEAEDKKTKEIIKKENIKVEPVVRSRIKNRYQ